MRVLILRDRERVNRKALLGGTVRRVARSSGPVAQRTRMFEAERDIGVQSLRAELFERTQGSKADWFERRQECSSEHVCWAPRPRTWRLSLCAPAQRVPTRPGAWLPILPLLTLFATPRRGRGAPRAVATDPSKEPTPGTAARDRRKGPPPGTAARDRRAGKPKARREGVAPGLGRQEFVWTRVHSTCA